MSKVYSFRLDENNPREAEAKKTIKAWSKKGYSLRYIIVEALIELAKDHKNDEDLELVLERLGYLTDVFQNNKIMESAEKESNQSLSQSFIASVKKSAKEGVRSERSL